MNIFGGEPIVLRELLRKVAQVVALAALGVVDQPHDSYGLDPVHHHGVHEG